MLIKCPECGKKISNTCESCIHCGWKKGKNQPNKPKKHSVFSKILWIIICIACIRACFLDETKLTENSQQQSKNQEISKFSIKNTPKSERTLEDYFIKNNELVQNCKRKYNWKEGVQDCVCEHFIIFFLNGEEQHSFAVNQTLKGETMNAKLIYQQLTTKYPALVENLHDRCSNFALKKLN